MLELNCLKGKLAKVEDLASEKQRRKQTTTNQQARKARATNRPKSLTERRGGCKRAKKRQGLKAILAYQPW